MKRQSFIGIAACMLAAMLSYAAVSKLMEYRVFVIQLSVSPLLARFASQIAWTVPVAELAVSMMLVFPAARLAGLFASFALMFFFTGYIFTILHFSDTIPCSCGGILQHMSWNQHLVFNIFFVLLASLAALLHYWPNQDHRRTPVRK